MTFEEFSENCENKKCLLYQRIDDNCSRRSTQKNHFSKFLKKQDHTESTLLFRKAVWDRDAPGFWDCKEKADWRKVCRFWKCLTDEERAYILQNDNELWVNKDLDVAHVIPKSIDMKNYFNPNEAVLIGRLWHSRLDRNKHPITGKPITAQMRLLWFRRIQGKI